TPHAWTERRAMISRPCLPCWSRTRSRAPGWPDPDAGRGVQRCTGAEGLCSDARHGSRHGRWTILRTTLARWPQSRRGRRATPAIEEPPMSLTDAYDPQNIFARIIRGEAPCYRIYEDDDVLAFLDLYPQSFGHTLVIPRRSAACNLLDVDTDALCKVMVVVQRLTRAIVDELQPDGVQVAQFNGAAAGQTVFHIHVHIVPRYAGQDMRVHAAQQGDRGELEQLQARLVRRIAAAAERPRETAPRKRTDPGRRRPGSGVDRDCGPGLAPGLLRLDFLGLQALLALHDLERHLLSFLQRLEATALDGTEVHEQIGTALRGDEAEALGIVEPLDGAGLTLRHGVTPWISWGCTAAQEAWPDCIEQGVTRSDGADRPERPSSTWRL